MTILALGMPDILMAAPKSFVDDFQTVTTYNHQTYVDACAGTLPDWSIQTMLDAQTNYERAVRGGGKLRVSNWNYDNTFIPGVGRIEAIYVGWAGGIEACLGEPPSGRSNMQFTHSDLCVYGGVEFNRFQLTSQQVPDQDNGGQFGPDLKPGIAGVDDDGNGTTDEDPNCDLGDDGCYGDCGVDDDNNGKTDDPGDQHEIPPGGYGCGGDDQAFASGGPAREYLARGPDGKPGVAGIDDDGNGLTDLSDVPGFFGVDDDADGATDEVGEVQPDQNELGWPGSDDSDDINGDYLPAIFMQANIPTGSLIGLAMQLRGSAAQFSIQDVVAFQINNLDGADEIGTGFYDAGVRYNYGVCASGTVYGAQLWTENDLANPVETLGPRVNTDHISLDDAEVGVSTWQIQNALYSPIQNAMFTTNSTFGDSFQVLEGNLTPIVAQDRDKDGDVDGVDFAIFASCFNKAGNTPRTLGCSAEDASAFDTDGDVDVDGVDFAVFASCFNKAGNPPRRLGCIPDLSNPGGVVIPDNDLCDDATPIGEGQLLDNMISNATSSWGGNSTITGNCSGDDDDPGKDLWYEYTPTCTGTAVMITASTENTDETTFPSGVIMENTVVAVFSSCPPSLITMIDCVNVSGSGFDNGHGAMSVEIDQTSMSSVIIAVVGDDNNFGDRGQFALDVSCSP
jgi:hypothetical protein